MDALAPDAPLVHPDLGSYDYVKAVFSPHPGTNIANLTVTRKGDVEKGFAEAEWIFEREYTNPSVQHVPMETHVAIAQWKTGDSVDIWSSAQSPFTVRELFCHAFKLPLNKVRVRVPNVGGGFGGKAGIHLEPLVACLSGRRAAGPSSSRPRARRSSACCRAAARFTYRIKTGVLSDGRIIAQKMEFFWDAGAYADYAVNVTRASGYSAARPLRDPQRQGRRLHALHQQALRHRLSRLRPRRVLLGPRAPYGAGRRRPSAWTRWSSAGRTCSSPARSPLTGEKITEHTGDIRKCLDSVAEGIGYGALTRGARRRARRGPA